MNIDISGAKVLYTFPIDFPILGKLQLTETIVVSWIVMLLLAGVCIWLTHDLKVENISKKQAFAEMLVEMANNFVIGNMGEKFRHMVPFVAALTMIVSTPDIFSLQIVCDVDARVAGVQTYSSTLNVFASLVQPNLSVTVAE